MNANEAGTTMHSSAVFKEFILKVRRDVQLSGDSKSLLRTLKATIRYLDEIAADPNHALCTAHLAKELIDWMAQKQDCDTKTAAGKVCFDLFTSLLHRCYSAQKTTRSFLVARLYNAIIGLIDKVDTRRIKLHACSLLNGFPIEDEQADLFHRLKRVVLKDVQDSKNTASSEVLEEGMILVIEMQRKLMIHGAREETRSADGTRQTALLLFRELFDNTMAILCRFFPLSAPKAEQLYHTIMDTMETAVKPDEQELISILDDSVGFVDTILNYSGTYPGYSQFTDFLTLFRPLKSDPHKSCYRLLSQMVQLMKLDHPTTTKIEEITKRVRELCAQYPSHPLVVKVAIFLACQGIVYIKGLPQDIALGVSRVAINLFEALMHFVRHCPSEGVPELCRKCTSARRHLADKLLNIMIYLSVYQVRDVAECRTDASEPQTKLSYSVRGGCDLIKRKLTVLEELNCEQKRSMFDISLRYSISWIKCTLTMLRDSTKDPQAAVDIADVLKLLIGVQNRYRLEYLSDLHFVRLLEKTYIERPGESVSCWPHVSVRLIKLLLTLRDSTMVGSNEEQQSTAISAIIRTIMCYQINAQEQDPIRSLTVLQLYDHPLFDKHGFTFDCAPSPVEKITILAEELALVAKYSTSNALSVSDYFLTMTSLGDVRQNCLAFGMALHGLSENDVAKIPQTLLDTLFAALEKYKPKNNLERIKRSASLAMASYQKFSLLSRDALNRMRDVPFKTEHFRTDQIDGILLENLLDRDVQLTERMEAIRHHYSKLMATLTEEGFRSLWVLQSLAQISSILNNTARLFQLNYHHDRAVELQLFNLLLVSQRRVEQPYDQCIPLTFLLEQHVLTDVLLKRESLEWPTHAGGTLKSLDDLAERATSLLHPFPDDPPNNSKFALLNLHLGLAIYRASHGELELSKDLIDRSLRFLEHPSFADDTIGQLLRARTAQIVFRLTTEYNLPWPVDVPAGAFIRLMLANFNELQKLPTEHSFMLSLAMVEMTFDVLRYLIVRYDTGPLVEPHVEQLLKFLLRRGAALRAMHLLLLYGEMNADLERFNRCEIALRYLDRLLMFQPILSYRKKEKIPMAEFDPVLDDEYIGDNNRIVESCDNSPSTTKPIGVDDLVDDERKVVLKHMDSLNTPDGGSSTNLELLPAETTIDQYLIFGHIPNCDCRYCSHSQYKSIAFQTAALCIRLSVLQTSKPSYQTEQQFRTIIDHWRTEMEPLLDDNIARYNVSQRKTTLMAITRTLLQNGKYYLRQERYEPALEVYRWASVLTERESNVIDPALIEDIQFNRALVESLQSRVTTGNQVYQKRSCSMIEAEFNRFLAYRDSNGCNMASLNTQFSTLNMETPKTAPGSVMGRTQAPPKTVDRVNELIHSSRRYQPKILLGHSLLPDGSVPDRTYSASARKPKTVSIFVDSPPGPRRKKVVVPATVAKLKTASTSSSAVAKPKPMRKLMPEVEHLKDSNNEGITETSSSKSVEPVSTISYRDTLVKATPPCTPSHRKASNDETPRKIRRLVINDFPNLDESINTDTSTKTPRYIKVACGNPVEHCSPSLNRSFRDALVLGEATKQTDTSVIILDDSTDKSQHSVEAIDTSVLTSHAVLADACTGLSLKSYSDRKRILGSGSQTPCITHRAAKTKLRFDDTSLDHDSDGDRSREPDAVENGVMDVNGSVNKARVNITRVKKRNEPTKMIQTRESVGCIATRTRHRRKKIKD